MKVRLSPAAPVHFAGTNERGRKVPVCNPESRGLWLRADRETVSCTTCQWIATHMAADLLTFLHDQQTEHQGGA